jgi:hypothetical protein
MVAFIGICYSLERCMERVTHLFLHCVVAWELGLGLLACLVFPRYCRIPCCSYLVGRDVLAREAMGKFGKLFLHA